MRPALKGALVTLLILSVTAIGGTAVFLKVTGLSARAVPGTLETSVARRLRGWSVPTEYRRLSNPVPANEESIRDGMSHFADHCASCHGNDGSGTTDMGKGLFPPAPDMRLRATQRLPDGDLFYVIEHGVRFTGMPAWGTGSIEGEESSWHLVNFIRHLPSISAEEIAEMEAMNPRPPAEIRQQIEEQRFLQGDDPSPSQSGEVPQPHDH